MQFAHAVSKRRTTGGVALTTASDVQAALDANPEGTVFRFAAGTYRPPDNEGYHPKAGQKLIGAVGAKLNGAKVLTSWTVAGSQWWASAFLPGATDGSGDCTVGGTGGLCRDRQDVFYDGAPMTRVGSIGAATAGKFFTDYGTNRVYVGSDPNGHTVEQAWNYHIVKSTNAGIVIQNFIIEMSSVNAQEGAIAARGPGWTIAYNELRYNHGGGIDLGYSSGASTHIHNNHIHHNGQIGIAGSSHHHVIEYNRINNNNIAGFSTGWDAGGMKVATDTWYDCVVRGNWVHDNTGTGLWWDVQAGTTDIDSNYVRNNISGIQFETCYGTRPAAAGGGGVTYIRNNIIASNQGSAGANTGGIIVAASPDVEVYGNSIYDENGAILGFQQDRSGDPADARGAHEIKNLYVHDNFCDLNGPSPPVFISKMSLWTDWASAEAWLWAGGSNNRFENNTYRHSSSSIAYFDWSTQDRTFAQWQAFGNDDTGSFQTGGASTIPDPPTLIVGPRS